MFTVNTYPKKTLRRLRPTLPPYTHVGKENFADHRFINEFGDPWGQKPLRVRYEPAAISLLAPLASMSPALAFCTQHSTHLLRSFQCNQKADFLKWYPREGHFRPLWRPTQVS